MIPRDTYKDEPTEPVADEADHYYRCETCGGWVDMRDLAMVMDHEGPLPHPTDSQTQ